MNRRILPAPALLCAVSLGLLMPLGAAHAASAWEHAHPRRDQVLDRTQHLNARIRRERHEGELTGAQAHQLHGEVRHTRIEQRAMARSNGGYITKAQQTGLDQQENAISRQVGR